MNVIFFIFCFLNLYGPLSTNITFLFNVILFLSVFSSRWRVVYNRIYLYIPIILLTISIVAFVNTRDAFKDISVIGTYVRFLANCVTFPSIIAFFYQKRIKILEILSFTLLLHCVMVLLQMIFPSLQDINVTLFRFERDTEILKNLTLRRLGLTGSYDISAMYSVLSAVISIELFYLTSKSKYTTFAIISFFASLFTSRTGMVAAVLMIAACVLMNKKKESRTSPIIITSFLIISVFYFIVPIVLNTMGMYNDTELLESKGYSTGTVDYLFDYQLEPLGFLNQRELIWGYGCGVRNVSMLYFFSDIGYVKQIYQVGIAGVVLMVCFAFFMTKEVFKRYKKNKVNNVMRIGNQIMWLLLLLYLVFNYKNHVLCSVCSFEVYLILYVFFCCYSVRHVLNEHSRM